MFAALMFFLLLSAGVFAGALMAWMMAPQGEHPFPRLQGLLVARYDRGNATQDTEVADGCVPVLANDNTREADVLASMVDKALEAKAKVAVTDRTFTVDASAAVAPLTMVFSPPLTVPGGSAVPVPQPQWTTATVRTSGRIVCEVRTDGVCTPRVETPALDVWNATNGSAGVAMRAEHSSSRPDEVRVDFQMRAAVDGGAASDDGLFASPPSGGITFSNGKKTLTPTVGHARWRCDWVL